MAGVRRVAADIWGGSLLRILPILRILGWPIALLGVLTASLTLIDSVTASGGIAYDFHAYWVAGNNLLAGRPLYAPVEINDWAAYRYLPTFAVAMTPLSLLPEVPATWLFRFACLLSLRYLVGSWRAAGWALLFPPVVVEMIALNVTLPIAAASKWALRSSSGSALLPAAAALKYGPGLLVPFIWARRAASRRGMALGAAVVGGAVLVHVVVDPDTWAAFFTSLAQQAESPNDAPYVGDQLLFLVPSTLGDFLLRFALAAVLTLIAIRRDWGWLAFGAATIAVPTLWLGRLAPLVAVPVLWWEERNQQERDQAGEAELALRSRSSISQA